MTSPLTQFRPERVPATSLRDLAAQLHLSSAGDPGVTGTTSESDTTDVPVAEIPVTGVTVASDAVVPGDLFVGVPGFTAHGARFAPAAVAAGAVAVVTDAAGAALLPADLGAPVLLHDDPRAVAGVLADVVYGGPSDRLVTVGVTGTNGKTTTTYFVEAALRAGMGTSALMGTVELRIGDQGVESPRTTVEAPALHRLMAVALERGVTNLTTEVSSHAIALHRLAGVRFDVVAFTNLQRDHLDFHGDMESYFGVKASLFAPGQAERGVVVVDDEWGRRLAASSPIPVASLATHRDAPEADRADWRVVSADIGLDGVGSTFDLRGPDGAVHTAFSPLPGLVNVSNAATAIVVAVSAGVPIDVAIDAVARVTAIPGRMERVVERGQGLPLCIVDYAHTPDALVYALEAVRPITPGRLVLVLGSDGDRDQGKRPMLGEIAARLADVVVVTDENPRSEVPGTIRASIIDGAREVRPDLTDVVEIADGRAAALRHAMDLTREGDTVIVTGKGHEPTQEIAGVFHRYNDRDVYLEHASALLRERA